MKKLFCIICFLTVSFLYSNENRKYNLNKLKYNLSSEKVVKLWGEPDEILDDYVVVYKYKSDDSTIYINFFTDNKLSHVYIENSDGSYNDWLPLKHSFFENSKRKGKYKLSGYESEKDLLQRNYEQKYFYFSQLYHELQITENENSSLKGKRWLYYSIREDRIVYTFIVFDGATMNNTVVAHIIADEDLKYKDVLGTEVGFIVYDKNNDGVIGDDEGDRFHNQYYLEIDPNKEYRKKFINLDMNEDGITESEEGLYVSY